MRMERCTITHCKKKITHTHTYTHTLRHFVDWLFYCVELIAKREKQSRSLRLSTFKLESIFSLFFGMNLSAFCFNRIWKVSGTRTLTSLRRRERREEFIFVYSKYSFLFKMENLSLLFFSLIRSRFLTDCGTSFNCFNDVLILFVFFRDVGRFQISVMAFLSPYLIFFVVWNNRFLFSII